MKSKEEILILLEFLERRREEAIDNDVLSLALAIGSQIELLKWVIGVK